MRRKEWLEKMRRLNYLGYRALGGDRTKQEDEEAERLLKELEEAEIERR